MTGADLFEVILGAHHRHAIEDFPLTPDILVDIPQHRFVEFGIFTDLANDRLGDSPGTDDQNRLVPGVIAFGVERELLAQYAGRDPHTDHDGKTQKKIEKNDRSGQAFIGMEKHHIQDQSHRSRDIGFENLQQVRHGNVAPPPLGKPHEPENRQFDEYHNGQQRYDHRPVFGRYPQIESQRECIYKREDYRSDVKEQNQKLADAGFLKWQRKAQHFLPPEGLKSLPTPFMQPITHPGHSRTRYQINEGLYFQYLHT